MSSLRSVRFIGGPLDGELRALSDLPYLYEARACLDSHIPAWSDRRSLVRYRSVLYRLERLPEGFAIYVYQAPREG